MSVQVKTPTKPQFAGIEIQCGEKRDSQGEGVKKWKDDFHVNTKFSQPWNRKRRYSQSYRRDDSGNPMRRKRIKSAYFEKPLPMRFLNGGSIDDPLNLNGLDSTELGKQLNSVTPQSSPLPTPKRQSVQVRIPVNVTDPLNLNESDEAKVQKVSKKKKHRHRHKKKDDSAIGTALFSPPKNVAKDKNLMEALRIDIEPEVQNVPCQKDNVVHPKPRVVCDKIVSPVIRQTTPKHKKRRRTNSDGKPDPSTVTSRSLLTSSSSNLSPKKFKQPKQPCKGKGSKSMQGGQVKFVYGNYNRYYGYRNPAMEIDHRIECFSKDWFEGKCVLDIGCNVGHLTLAIAKEFSPSKVTGIDIDHKLITAARKNIRYYISSSTADISKFPISNLLNYGPIEAPPIQQKGQTAFPHNVMFMQGNYVLEHDELLDIQREEYDVIMALSITKWIHFNWGDAGLKRFFKRVYKQLRPGGMFILEPQPWSSYKKKKKLTDAIFKNFQSIRLRPEQFNDYLLSKEIGFSTCKTMNVAMNKSKGFRRPIMVFRKSETVQNSPLSECGNVTPPPRRNESLVSMATSEVVSDRMSEYSSCSTCSCSSCCSESPVKHDEVVNDMIGEVKVADDAWEAERLEEVTDSMKDKSAEETSAQVSAETEMDNEIGEVKVADDTWETERLEEVTDSAKDISAEETSAQVSTETEIDNEIGEVKVADDTWETERLEEGTDSAKDKSAEETSAQVSTETAIGDFNKLVVRDDDSATQDLLKANNNVDTELSKDVDKDKPEVLKGIDDKEPELSEDIDKGEPDMSKGMNKNEPNMSEDIDKGEPDMSKDMDQNNEPKLSEDSDKHEPDMSKGINKNEPNMSEDIDKGEPDMSEDMDKKEPELSESVDKIEKEVSMDIDTVDSKVLTDADQIESNKMNQPENNKTEN